MSSSLRLIAALAALALSFHGLHAAPLDVSPADGLPDIWAYVNGVGSLPPTGDEDGDGESNADEAIAGTNPRVGGDMIRVKSFAKNGANVTLVFPAVASKRYEILASDTPAAADFAPLPVPSIHNPTVDGDLPVTVPGGSKKFFCVTVKDRDTDGDGLTDYEERMLGLNPNSATTSPGVNDFTYVSGQLALPDTVSVRAVRSFASEDGQAGIFEFSRTRTLFAITVPFAVSGTATPATDYIALPGSVSFAQGEDRKTVSVNPNLETPNIVESGEAVTVTLLPPPPSLSGAYTLGASTTASVIIGDTITPSGSGLRARYYDHASINAADALNFGQPGTYTYTRTSTGSPNTGLIVVPFTYNGPPALQVGHVVRMAFTSGNLNNALYSNQNYTVSAVSPGVNFTLAISGATLPTNSTGNASFSIQSFPHPAVIDRIDPTVDFDWIYGTPNDVAITPNNPVDNISAYWEGYLAPAMAGDYTFQLDADDRARVLLDTGSGLVQILEHGWDAPATVGTFKLSAPITLAVPAPATPAARYKIRVEWVDASGDARCRLQWRLGTGAFANIAAGNVFSHMSAMTGTGYSFTRTNSTPGAMAGNIVVQLAGHTFIVGDNVQLAFSSGNLFIPTNGNFHGTYAITAVNSGVSFTADIAVPTLPATGIGAGFVLNPNSTATGWFSQAYTNTTLTNPPGRVGIDGAGVTTLNNGLWGSGTPDPVLIGKDTFSIRWTGQMQPEFSEEYTIAVLANDGCTLRINGQIQPLKTAPATNQAATGYWYDNATGNAIIAYPFAPVVAGSFKIGETVRIDPSSGNLAHAPPVSPTYSYDSVTGIAMISYSTLATVIPGAFLAGDVIELDPTNGNLTNLPNLPYPILASPAPTATTFAVSIGVNAFVSGSGNVNVNDTRNAVITALHAAGVGTYSYDAATGDTVINYSSITALPSGTFAVGGSVQVDPTSGGISALVNSVRTITASTPTTFTVNLGIGASAINTTGGVNIVDPRTGVIPDQLTTAFTVHVGAGRYANASVGGVGVEIANKTLREWSSMGSERYIRIPLIGGLRYDIQLDYYDNTSDARCRLFWFSQSQPRQIIPSLRLYPDSTPGVTMAPPIMVSPTSAFALVGGAFAYPIAGSNGSNVSISGNPAWLTLNGGVLTGTPPPGAVGSFQILVTTTGPNGIGKSVIDLEVQDAGGTISREFWNGVPGTTVASIPTGTAPSGSATLSSLEAPTDLGDNYGARIRGYLTAPLTGNYYFWLAASDAAELWISNDAEPVNVFKRAALTGGSATPQTWSARSPWMALEEGKRYYIEILHKAGAGTVDNLAVGWLKPGQTGTVPSEVVPGFVLSPYVAPAPGSTPGNLYFATMRAQAGAITNGVGTSTFRLSADETSAIVNFNYNGLTGILTDWHVHSDPYLSFESSIMYDPNAPGPNSGLQPDGSHKWTIPEMVGGKSRAAVVELIKQGKAYINIHTADYPAGEIRGNYTLANGSRTFSPPPPPLSWPDDSNSNNGASRFLTQATFGPSPSDIAALRAIVPSGGKTRYELWIDDQFTKPASDTLPEVLRTERSDAQGGSAFDETLLFNAWWRNSITGADQLRQRAAFALSEIHVVSAQGPLDNNGRALAFFYDMLNDHAFGNFRDLLEATTLSWTMGRYLDMFRNDKPDLTIGRIPNENYAREIKQLFSIGLFRKWPDGTLMLNSKDELIDTYSQREIVGYAKAFTGWDYGYDGAYRTSFGAAADFTRNMREVPARHFTGPKRILNNEVLPGVAAAAGQPLDPYAAHTANVLNDPSYEALAAQELDAAHDQLFNHPNVGPFICRQLIQRMVTSNPSRDYLYRVVQKFNDNGAGVRGDMQAVIKAILLDYEARSVSETITPAFGKQREPVLRIAAAGRAFRPSAFSGTYVQNSTSGRTITINTSTPHRLASNNNVFIEFTSGSPLPFIGVYSPSVTGANSFTVQANGWATGTYNIPANSTVCTVSIGSHWLEAGQRAYFDFTSGPGNGLAGFDNTVHTAVTSNSVGASAGTSFTITVPTTSASSRTGNVMIPRFTPGSYVTLASGLPAPQDRRVTMDTNFDHHLNVGDQVQINFFAGNPVPTDMVVTVESVVDLDTWTFLAPSLGTNLGTNQGNNSVYQFPLVSQPLTRSGNVGSRPSTFQMGNTDLDIDQTPLNSPTVFNFYLPDYKFPGAIASQGITTPEFQETAETTVVRQANFIERGIFALGNDVASSFRSGSNVLLMNFSDWLVDDATNLGLGVPTSNTLPWTHNQNIAQLIAQLNSLLVGGQLPPNVINQVRDFVSLRIASIGTGLTSCTVTTISPHGFVTGDSVVISGVTTGTFGSSLNSTSTARTVTVTGSNTFTIPVSCAIVPTATGLANAHVSMIPYDNGSTTPSVTQRRDRLRSILHLILTSPDFTIQR